MTTDERVLGKPKVRVLWNSLLFCHTLETYHTGIFSKGSKVSLTRPYSLLAGSRWSISAHLFTRLLPAGSLCPSSLAPVTQKVSLLSGRQSSLGSQAFSPISFSYIKTCFYFYYFQKRKENGKEKWRQEKNECGCRSDEHRFFYDGKVLKLARILGNLYRAVKRTGLL